jgi:hypothetical protein
MYFPKSQITPNLYTNGSEFVYVDDPYQYYSGYYFKTSSGKYYSGKTPSDRPNIELIPQVNNFSNGNLPIEQQNPALIDSTGSLLIQFNSLPYVALKNINTNNVTTLPYYSPVYPTQQDYQNGEFQRYFCKKTNQLLYIEINQEQFDKLVAKDPQIEFSLYQPFYIDWQLTGDKEQVAKVNRNSTELVVFKNKFLGLNEYLRFDWTKYYQQFGTVASGSYINRVNQGYVLDNRDGRSTRVSSSQDDSGSIRRDNSIPR